MIKKKELCVTSYQAQGLQQLHFMLLNCISSPLSLSLLAIFHEEHQWHLMFQVGARQHNQRYFLFNQKTGVLLYKGGKLSITLYLE